MATFLKELIADEEESADSFKRLDRTLDRRGDPEYCSEECNRLLRGCFPSAFGRFGEGCMDRDTTLHFVEVLEAERLSFLNSILNEFGDDSSGSRIKAEWNRSANRLRVVKTIVLPFSNGVGPKPVVLTSENRCPAAIVRRSWVADLSTQINQLRNLLRDSSPSERAGDPGVPPAYLWNMAVTALLRDLADIAHHADKSDEPLARRFIDDFADLPKDGTAVAGGILGAARVALAWLLCGHSRWSS